jgi:hypothetical protein
MRSSKLRDVMVIAEKEGLLRGERSLVVRGRMPEALVPGQESAPDLILIRS